MLIVGSILAVLLFVLWNGRYSNFGTNLIDGCFYKPPMTIYPRDWLFKMLLTIGCLSVGFVGGEVTPLFAIGSSLGFVIGPLFGMDPAWSAALGYAAVFGAGTNTWLAPIMVGIEILVWRLSSLLYRLFSSLSCQSFAIHLCLAAAI